MRMGTEFAARFSLFFVVYLIASCLAYPLTSFKQNIRVQSGIKSLDRITFRIVERENAKYRYSFPVSLSRDLVSSFLERFGATRFNCNAISLALLLYHCIKEQSMVYMDNSFCCIVNRNIIG